jgi:hypothetical protein
MLENKDLNWWIDKLNSNDLSNMPKHWEKSKIVQQAHISILNDLVNKKYNVPNFPVDKGIVIGAGGAKFFACAFASFYVLRKLGCSLPFEFWYLDDYEMDNKMLNLCYQFGIDPINAKQFSLKNNLQPRILNGWELKPFAVLHSKFKEVLYLDADNIPTRDVSFLFDLEEYKNTGAIFWPDLRPSDREEWLPSICWENIGMDYQNSIDFETGQFLINKEKCYKELCIAMWMNEHSDWFYKFIFGDKSTFHFAWKKCGTNYSMTKRSAGWKDCWILQYDLDRKLLFQHLTGGKEKLVEGKNLSHLMNNLLVYEAKTVRDTKWSGEIYSWNEMNDDELNFAKTFIGTYTYTRIALDSRPLALLDNGKIGKGRASCEKRWTVRIINNIPNIIVIGEAHKQSEIAMFFAKPIDDTYQEFEGRWSVFEKCPITLKKI